MWRGRRARPLCLATPENIKGRRDLHSSEVLLVRLVLTINQESMHAVVVEEGRAHNCRRLEYGRSIGRSRPISEEVATNG